MGAHQNKTFNVDCKCLIEPPNKLQADTLSQHLFLTFHLDDAASLLQTHDSLVM